jgi:hypothetical protein
MNRLFFDLFTFAPQALGAMRGPYLLEAIRLHAVNNKISQSPVPLT